MATPEDDDDRRVLEEVAERIADARPVEWQARAAQSPAAGSRLEKLKLLERLARAFRSAAERSGIGPPAAPSPPPGPDETAEVVLWGHLRILAKLGEGGFGEVYRAHDPVLDRQVALKLRREGRTESDQRYLEEARRLAKVRHPNVLVVYGADVREGRVGLWTDLIHGETLEQRLARDGPLGAPEAIAIGLDLCRALAAVHAQGLLHGDVKTSNVMRERGGRIVLMDFGTVKEISHEGGSVIVSRGTPVAFAPELLRGERGSAASDIYSLGVLLFRLVTGRYPVEGESLGEIARKHEQGGSKPLRDLRPDLPAPFVRAVERALAPNPQERYPSAGAMERALAEAAEQVSATLPPAAKGHRRAWAAAVLAAIVVAVAVDLLLRRTPPRAAGSRAIQSLAVLPLENLSRDPEQEYLVDGMTEALITRLAQIGSVKVISRTSVMRYKGTQKPVRDVASELGVEAVIEGSVLRAGNRVRITAQLIDGATDAHLWAKDYEGDLKDVLALQAQVAGAIVGEIRAALNPGEQARLRAARAVDPEAYKAYLLGRHLFEKGDPANMQAVLGKFQEAIDRDPSFAHAYLGLAQAYNHMGGTAVMPGEEALTRAGAAARKALEIDPELAEAYSTLGWSTIGWEWDWAEGERLLRKGLELKPNDARGHELYSDYLKCTGRNDEAVAGARRARELDPLSPIIVNHLGNVLYFVRRYDEAIAVLRAPREEAPLVSRIVLGSVYLQKGEHAKAIAEFRKVKEMAGGIPLFDVLFAMAHAAAGRRDEALAVLREVEQAKVKEAFPVAMTYALLGDKDKAFASLERSYRNREWFMVCLRAWPELDRIRSDPRYHTLVERMRFPPWGQPPEPVAPAPQARQGS